MVEGANRAIGFEHSSKLDIHLRDEDKAENGLGNYKLFLNWQAGVFPSVDASIKMVDGLEIVLLKYLQ